MILYLNTLGKSNLTGHAGQVSSKNVISANNRLQCERLSFCSDSSRKGVGGILPHNNPIIVVPGTSAVGSDGDASGWINFFKNSGHNVISGERSELLNFPTIKDGGPLQEGIAGISRYINESRVKIARKNLTRLEGKQDSIDGLKEFFGILNDENSTREMLQLIPGVISQLNDATKGRTEEIFSTRVNQIETDFAEKLNKQTTFGNWDKENKNVLCEKAAAGIINTIAPKAVLVGLSMGGYCSYAAALNPKKGTFDNNSFSYDAGNGISYVVLLATPVKGMSDSPKGVMEAPVELAYRNNPFLKLMDPFGVGRAAYRTAVESSRPFVYQAKPGWEQVRANSTFTKQYIKGKKVPDNVSVLSIFHRKDGIVEPETAKTEVSCRNSHDVEVDFPVKNTHNLTMTDEQNIHNSMGKRAEDCNSAFTNKILSSESFARKLLDKKNSDDLRYQTLSVIFEQTEKNPEFFAQDRSLIEEIKSVRDENMPFKTSPSYLAGEILKIISREKG